MPHLADLWDVLLLFLIPIGGGIPAGVILAKDHGLHWPMMTVLYFISDVIQACIFELILLAFLRWGKETAFITKVRGSMKRTTAKTMEAYGAKPGPFALVAISFGVDPMTGRSVAYAVGHGFLAGWAFAITGDMVFFVILMVSTLFLNNILGDGTWTAVIIMAAMFIIPAIIRRVRKPAQARG